MHLGYQALLNETATNSVRVQQINAEAARLLKAGHSQAKLITSRQQQLGGRWAPILPASYCCNKSNTCPVQRWKMLQSMKTDKESALSVVKSMYDFHQVCDETKAWISEKDQALSAEEWGRDLAGAQMLQRRHQVCRSKNMWRSLCFNWYYSSSSYVFIALYLKALERELTPVEERILKISEMAVKVAEATPKDTRQVQSRQLEIASTWEKLKVSSRYRCLHI